MPTVKNRRLSLKSSKRNLVYSRLSKRLRILGLDDFEAYCNVLEDIDGENVATLGEKWTSPGSEFQTAGASGAKLKQNYVTDL